MRFVDFFCGSAYAQLNHFGVELEYLGNEFHGEPGGKLQTLMVHAPT
jgi:hypothetical protein